MAKAPAISVTGTEFGIDWSDPNARAIALPKFLQAFQGKHYVNRELQIPISVGKRGIKKVFSHLPHVKPAMALAKLPELLEWAVWKKDEAPRTPDQNVRAWHYLTCRLLLQGVEHSAEIKIREDGNGHWFYDQHLTLKAKEDSPSKPGTSASGSTSAGKSSSIRIICSPEKKVKKELGTGAADLRIRKNLEMHMDNTNMPTPLPPFLRLPSPGPEHADALLLPLPVEKTVSYGTGAAGGPRAIIESSRELETFDEETLVEFADAPRLHTLSPISSDGTLEDCLARIRDAVRPLRGRFLLALGGEHSVTYGVVTGLVDNPAEVTIVQIDAHADLADELDGRRWSHGTVMRRLWDEGCSLVQIGIRSLSRAEYDTATAGPRIVTYYAHRLEEQWAELLDRLRRLEGKVYLTIDVDGLDPSIIPSTGTPQPGGLSWQQTLEIIRTLATQSSCELLAADIVEFVPSPAPPGCDPTAARLAAKVLAYWWRGENAI